MCWVHRYIQLDLYIKPRVGTLKRWVHVHIKEQGPLGKDKAQPHAVMLHTLYGTFQNCCDTSKSHAMCCDAFSNILQFMLPILEYLSHLLSNFETVCSIVMLI